MSSRYTIHVIEDTVTVNQRVTVEYDAPDKVRGSLWSRMDCTDPTGNVVLSQYERLDDPGPDGHYVGVTPSWDGTTPLVCTVRLLEHTGTFGRAKAEDTFEVRVA